MVSTLEGLSLSHDISHFHYLSPFVCYADEAGPRIKMTPPWWYALIGHARTPALYAIIV